jgi:hypothetical protein
MTSIRHHRVPEEQSPLSRYATGLVRTHNLNAMRNEQSRPFVGLNIGYEEWLDSRGRVWRCGNVSISSHASLILIFARSIIDD